MQASWNEHSPKSTVDVVKAVFRADWAEQLAQSPHREWRSLDSPKLGGPDSPMPTQEGSQLKPTFSGRSVG